jgi:hypothetical protein
MIELSPKALRFARLVAEMQQHGTADGRVYELRRLETQHAGSAGRYLSIPDDLARFCLHSIRSFLLNAIEPNEDWDSNDIAFLTSISDDLSDNLSAERSV